MAQVPFGSCIDQTRPRPILSQPDLGEYTVERYNKCKYGVYSDGVRRRDLPVPTWAYHRAGVPQVPSMENDNRPFDRVQTEQGPIEIRKGPVGGHYLPSVAVLNGAPYVDTRRTAISDRYYR